MTSIAHGFWNNFTKADGTPLRPADQVINEILAEDASLYADYGQYLKNKTEGLAKSVWDKIIEWLKEHLMDFLIPAVEIALVAFLGIAVIENII